MLAGAKDYKGYWMSEGRKGCGSGTGWRKWGGNKVPRRWSAAGCKWWSRDVKIQGSIPELPNCSSWWMSVDFLGLYIYVYNCIYSIEYSCWIILSPVLWHSSDKSCRLTWCRGVATWFSSPAIRWVLTVATLPATQSGLAPWQIKRSDMCLGCLGCLGVAWRKLRFFEWDMICVQNIYIYPSLIN